MKSLSGSDYNLYFWPSLREKEEEQGLAINLCRICIVCALLTFNTLLPTVPYLYMGCVAPSDCLRFCDENSPLSKYTSGLPLKLFSCTSSSVA